MFQSALPVKISLKIKENSFPASCRGFCKPVLLIEGTVSDDFKCLILEWTGKSLAMRFFVSPFKACEGAGHPRDCCQINYPVAILEYCNLLSPKLQTVANRASYFKNEIGKSCPSLLMSFGIFTVSDEFFWANCVVVCPGTYQLVRDLDFQGRVVCV